MFLHGQPTKNVYIKPPPGFNDLNHTTYLCKLQRPLYGLKQAPHACFECLSSHLHNLGFHWFKTNDQHTKEYVALLLVYIDDIILIGTLTAPLDDLITSL